MHERTNGGMNESASLRGSLIFRVPPFPAKPQGFSFFFFLEHLCVFSMHFNMLLTLGDQIHDETGRPDLLEGVRHSR